MSAQGAEQSMTGTPFGARVVNSPSTASLWTVLALDPGVTTGWAKFTTPNNRDGYTSGQIEDGALGLWGALKGAQAFTRLPDVIVCESFQYRPKLDKAVLVPVEVIGAVKVYCFENNIKLVFQTPAQRMWWDDDKLKRAEVYRPGKPHANDAMRHLLTYINVLPPRRG